MMINWMLFFFLVLFCSSEKIDRFPPPPGTKSIGLNLFVDKETITVADWTEFIYSQNFKNISDSVQCFNLDTALYLDIYNTDPRENLPIIGKTIGEINEYCLWRSRMVNALIYQIKPDCNGKFWKKCSMVREQKKKVNYFIPSAEEYSKNYNSDITYLKIEPNTSFFEKTNLPFICFARYE